MKKKNKIEQELDRKEFEKELHRDLSSEYKRLDGVEMLHKGKNKYVVAAINFLSTFVFFEMAYWLIKMAVNFFTLGFSVEFFEMMNPFIHLAVLILSISAVITRKSAIETVVEKWPF